MLATQRLERRIDKSVRHEPTVDFGPVTLSATHRPVRSYHARRGRLRVERATALKELMPRYGVAPHGDPLDLAELFGTDTPVVLEIGSGMGDATAAMALADSETGILACEVHDAGVANLLQTLAAEGLENVRVLHGDAVELLHQRVPAGALAGVRVFFPDPWHKARHRKRRLIQPAFASLVSSRLSPGGYLHCATDWSDYANQMLEVLSAEPRLRNIHEGFAPDTRDRPVTRYEQRGIGKGHQIYDLVFTRI